MEMLSFAVGCIVGAVCYAIINFVVFIVKNFFNHPNDN